MRDLSVVAMLLGITAACSNQPTTTALPRAETDARAGRQRLRAPDGFHRAASVRAVAMVARGADDGVVMGRFSG